MKAVTNFKYLFQRNKIYYFRLKLTKRLPQPEIAFSLKTEVIADAVAIWQKLIPYPEKLKQLILLGDTVGERECLKLYKGLKSGMLKQLRIHLPPKCAPFPLVKYLLAVGLITNSPWGTQCLRYSL